MYLNKAFFKFIYLRKRASECAQVRERQREGRSRLSTEQGAWYGAQSQDPEIMTWAEGRCLTNWVTQCPYNTVLFLFFKDFIYLFMRNRGAENKAGSMQGARCGTRYWDSRIMPWAEGRHSTTEPPVHPYNTIFKNTCYLPFISGYKIRSSLKVVWFILEVFSLHLPSRKEVYCIMRVLSFQHTFKASVLMSLK